MLLSSIALVPSALAVATFNWVKGNLCCTPKGDGANGANAPPANNTDAQAPQPQVIADNAPAQQ